MKYWKKTAIIRGYLLGVTFLAVGTLHPNIYLSWFNVLVAFGFFVITTINIFDNES